MSLIFRFSRIATPSPAARSDRQVHEGEQKRVRERLAKHRVLSQGGVVREPDEVASRQEVRVRERQIGPPRSWG